MVKPTQPKWAIKDFESISSYDRIYNSQLALQDPKRPPEVNANREKYW